jgi:hypothetical protein
MEKGIIAQRPQEAAEFEGFRGALIPLLFCAFAPWRLGVKIERF